FRNRIPLRLNPQLFFQRMRKERRTSGKKKNISTDLYLWNTGSFSNDDFRNEYFRSALQNLQHLEKVKLTEFSHGGGCGCKIAPAVLEEILRDSKTKASFQNL